MGGGVTRRVRALLSYVSTVSSTGRVGESRPASILQCNDPQGRLPAGEAIAGVISQNCVTNLLGVARLARKALLVLLIATLLLRWLLVATATTSG